MTKRIENIEPRDTNQNSGLKIFCYAELLPDGNVGVSASRLIVCLFLFLTVLSCNEEPKNSKITGPVFGTGYAIIYDYEVNYQTQFDSLFDVINQSMSTYITDSDISLVNKNMKTEVDEHFKSVFNASKLIYEETDGVFDPTIGVVVNAWDFGPKGAIKELDSLKIDSLMRFVGLDKVKLNDNRISKPDQTFIDFNAIAKGYGVDVIAEFLESRGIQNYLVEIGGEIRCKGENVEKKLPWRVGIDEPNFDGSQSVLKSVKLRDESMATSGTYRKYKVDENGNRYAHIIDTKSGYPTKTNVLSVSVMASSCMVADAYATAFQAMGISKTIDFLENHPELKVHFVYIDRDVEAQIEVLRTLSLNGFPE